jgi:hypothetical protein
MTDRDHGILSAEVLRSITTPSKKGDVLLKNAPGEHRGAHVRLGRTWADELLLLIPMPGSNLGVTEAHYVNDDLRIEPRVLLDDGGTPITYAALVAAEGFDVSLFGAFTDELIHELDDERTPLEMMHEILDRWSTLLKASGLRRLSRSEATGLYGELLALRALVEHQGDSAVDMWVGPDKQRHDFVWSDSAVEVKSTLQSQGLSVRIHQLGQLRVDPGQELHLLVIKLEWNPGGQSLKELILEVRGRLKKPAAFDEKLTEFGLSSKSLESAQEFRFRETGATVFEVDESFPAITERALEHLPNSSRIKDVEYSLDLSGLSGQEVPNLDQLFWKGVLHA